MIVMFSGFHDVKDMVLIKQGVLEPLIWLGCLV